jgi:ATP adenylyltransferase
MASLTIRDQRAARGNRTPAALWPKVIERTRHALRCGALVSLGTKTEYLEERGVRFIVRILADPERKANETQPGASPEGSVDPFLPYDNDLFVVDLSASHVCLLNKFNVMDHHLLIVTRAFEEQEALLNRQDFDAVWACMTEIDGLAFYNGGRVAGASQRHKHLQLLPLPLGEETPPVPIEPLLGQAHFRGACSQLPAFGFKHALTRLDAGGLESRPRAADTLLATYHSLLEPVGIMALASGRQSAPYNLLFTRRWMLLVPRSQECFGSMSVNALGFAGALLVRTETERHRLRRCGPLDALKTVAVPLA